MIEVRLLCQRVRKRARVRKDPMVVTLAMLTVVILLACSVRIFVSYG